MRTSFRIFSLFTLLAVFLASGCATTNPNPAPIKEKTAAMVAEYQDWPNTAAKVVLEKTSPFYGFQRVLVSKKALLAYKNGGQYPEGSQLVLEFNEPVPEGPEGDDIVKGSVNWIAVMTKDSSATKTGGWIYEAYDGNPAVAIKKDIDPIAGCYNCHTAMKHKDYIFSSMK